MSRYKKLSLSDKALLAMEESVYRVILEHKKNKRPLVIWKNNKVAYISAKEALKDKVYLKYINRQK